MGGQGSGKKPIYPKREKTTLSSNRGKAITKAEKESFLELVGRGVPKPLAADEVGRALWSFFRIARDDPEFASALEDATYVGAEYLIAEAERRGAEGWDEPVFQKGQQVGVVRKYDSNLLMFATKGRRPEYKDNPKVALQIGTQVKFEDRSASVLEMWKVLADAGVDAGEVAQSLERNVGGRTAGRELPVVEGSLAELPDVQPEASRVSRTSES